MTSGPSVRRAAAARRSSLADVAALAGVSKGTVSHVLNHPERVAEATRQRVESAIAELSFVPHGTARSLAVGTMPAVGLVLSDVANSLFVEMLRGVERIVEERNGYVLIANSYTDLDRERRYLGMFEAVHTLGALVSINNPAHYESLAAHHRGERPLVFLDYRNLDDRYCSVHADNRAGGAIAARHLVELGRRRLAVVSPPYELQPVAERLAGFEEVVDASDATIVARVGVENVHRADGWRVGRELLPRIESGEIDGIFAVADLAAAGVLQAVSASGTVDVPGDVAIVGYDDNQEAWDSPIPLTTVRQPGEDMGARGAELLFEEINDPSHEHRVVGLAPSLIVRQSTVGLA
ncbi:LacI family DNA-binding transcriptional regulator [Demequina silvatica]|uniref:LacI family DNA-binding transcriptional regulator n=1 Tax=Demequina silvatica TaxID=1638988 RepID=UPI000782F38C|nr:LacI family DNA-binding transcriptional regulator [Demequina silvatica]